MFPILVDRSRLVFEAGPSLIWLCQPYRGRLCSCIPRYPLTMSPHTLATHTLAKSTFHLHLQITPDCAACLQIFHVIYQFEYGFDCIACSSFNSAGQILDGVCLLFFGAKRRNDPHFKILHVPFGKHMRLLGTVALKIQNVGLGYKNQSSVFLHSVLTAIKTV